ncbi:hypothetical protein OPV22_030876 [Ensete ventricosum]|uniref:BHLH domain-containing protein n=1 Tax=Ensete ventricosum TaxID=4639 RepID=A0AAV8PT06_ENSVE|nr:hypothetical protein OPV22_030876 [Ensete ventricosum]
MDSFFLLTAEARGRFLQIAGRLLGCTYVCAWSPDVYHPAANHLISTDGWHREEEDGGGHASSSSGTGSVSSRLFDAYRRSVCSIQRGCIPGLAYEGGLTYTEFSGDDLMNLASIHVQRQFYQEAGIKTAVFVGCSSGEIELGMTTPPNMDVQMDIRQVFGEEFIRQSQLQSGEQSWRSSSSSSSLRSPSAGSPEGSSLLLTKAGAAAFMPDVVLPHQMAMQTYNLTSLPPSSSSSPLMYRQLVLERRHHPGGAFQGYNPTGAVRVEATPNVAGQRMIKKGIDVLRRISTAMMEAPTQEYRPTSDQLHHMISERRRREKLNQNFHALRLLLPPGSKKDKASVLANTKNYLDSLKARVSELQERNQLLELQLPPTDDAAAAAADGVSDSDERVRVEISRSGADDPNPSESQQINLRLVVRDEECDMTDLVVRTLECLKGMSRDVMLASVAASTMSPRKYTCARFNLKLREKVGDWDEASFKEAVTRAVAAVLLGRRATASP